MPSTMANFGPAHTQRDLEPIIASRIIMTNNFMVSNFFLFSLTLLLLKKSCKPKIHYHANESGKRSQFSWDSIVNDFDAALILMQHLPRTTMWLCIFFLSYSSSHTWKRQNWVTQGKYTGKNPMRNLVCNERFFPQLSSVVHTYICRTPSLSDGFLKKKWQNDFKHNLIFDYEFYWYEK